MSPNGSDDFLVAEWERRLSCRRMGRAVFLPPEQEPQLSCRRMGATTFLSPNGSNDFLVAEWEQRLPYRRMGAAAFLPPDGSNVFLAAEWEQRLPCRRMGATSSLSPDGSRSFRAADLRAPTSGIHKSPVRNGRQENRPSQMCPPYRLHSSGPGIPRLVNTSNPGSNANADTASSPLPVPAPRPRKIPRISPVRGFRRIVTGRPVSSSNLTDPPGPLSVIPASSPSHPTRTGSAKTNDDLPSPSPTSGIAKLNQNNSSPSTSRPVISNSPPDRGIAAGASTTNAGSRNGVPSDPTPPHSSRLFAGTATREDTSPPPATCNR